MNQPATPYPDTMNCDDWPIISAAAAKERMIAAQAIMIKLEKAPPHPLLTRQLILDLPPHSQT